jgi:hypothetical protein
LEDYSDNHETFLINTPNLGSITEIDDKVRIATPNLVPGDVITPYISIQKPETYPYTTDLNVVEVSISPQDSINEDIIAQLGSFNIDEYIGDPRLDTSSSYPALTELRNFYFKKYSDSQNIFDLIKLLSYFDNSLFKMIKDFAGFAFWNFSCICKVFKEWSSLKYLEQLFLQFVCLVFIQ